jgi:hypothetical protein
MKDDTLDRTTAMIVPSPIIHFTMADANKAVAAVPAKMRPDSENVFAVAAHASIPTIKNRQGEMIVTHYTKNMRTKKEFVAGSWRIVVPIAPFCEDHSFRVDWKDESEKTAAPQPHPEDALIPT